jgi:AraC family transcriptional regulator
MSNHPRRLVGRCLETMYAQLDAPLSVAQLAQQLCVSESVLKRAFAEVMDASPAALYRRLRLELAFRTLHSRERSVLETALASGFENHAAFSRSFRRAFGFAPSGARHVVTLQRELESIELEEPDIVELAALPMQVATASGSYFTCAPRAWASLRDALAALSPERIEQALFVGRALDDPHAPDGPDAAAVRFAAGVVGLAEDVALAHEQTRAGVYARFRYAGLLANIGLAYHYIYGAWREQAARSGFHLCSEPALIMFDELPRSAAQRLLIAVPLVEGCRPSALPT